MYANFFGLAGYARLAGLQALLVLGSLVAGFYIIPVNANALAYGGGMALFNTLLLAWRFKQGERKVGLGTGWVLGQAYRTVVERYIWAILWFAVGYKLLGLAPLWMMAGFVAGQVGWVFALVLFKA